MTLTETTFYWNDSMDMVLGLLLIHWTIKACNKFHVVTILLRYNMVPVELLKSSISDQCFCPWWWLLPHVAKLCVEHEKQLLMQGMLGTRPHHLLSSTIYAPSPFLKCSPPSYQIWSPPTTTTSTSSPILKPNSVLPTLQSSAPWKTGAWFQTDGAVRSKLLDLDLPVPSWPLCEKWAFTDFPSLGGKKLWISPSVLKKVYLVQKYLLNSVIWSLMLLRTTQCFVSPVRVSLRHLYRGVQEPCVW